jgi:hypothetical protein
MLHLVNAIPYVETLCGRDMATMADADWTDAIYEVVEDMDTSHVCLVCLGLARKAIRANRSNNDWQKEVAQEAGMLHGADAYNEVMGGTNMETITVQPHVYYNALHWLGSVFLDRDPVKDPQVIVRSCRSHEEHVATLATWNGR